MKKSKENSPHAVAYCRVENPETANPKTAIVYCRAATDKDAERQLEKAEGLAKQLSVTIEAVFIDVIPEPKLTIWHQTLRLFKPIKRPEWRKAIAYLENQKTDYIITHNPGQFSWAVREYVKMEKEIRRHGALILYSAVSPEHAHKFNGWTKGN